MQVLVVNAGSSTLKLRVVGAHDEVTVAADVPATGGRFDDDELTEWLARTDRIDAAGHRVVHGGDRFDSPVLITPDVERSLGELSALAPLHQPPALAGIAALRRAWPQLPAVACFDTGFHATLPDAAATYALPAEWRERWHLRRYGFHGLSHAWASRRAAELCGRGPGQPPGFRVISCHLGAGASIAAVSDGRCVDTTMGFTPLEGLVMATRSGNVDPGLLLWLQDQGQISTAELSDGLERRSGLMGLAGTSHMREVLTRFADGEPRARLALDVYVRSLSAHIAAMATSLGGIDALVFTGGVGENAPEIRTAVAKRLGWAGVDIDPVRNDLPPDVEITGSGPVRAFVVSSREDLEIARAVRDVVGRG